jgi:WXG100 family type VII secretion target
MAIGGDLEQLTTLQTTFTRSSGQIEELVATLTSQLGGVRWEGPAADRFRNMWASDFSPALGRIREALDDAGTEVGRRRDALEQAGS